MIGHKPCDVQTTVYADRPTRWRHRRGSLFYHIAYCCVYRHPSLSLGPYINDDELRRPDYCPLCCSHLSPPPSCLLFFLSVISSSQITMSVRAYECDRLCADWKTRDSQLSHIYPHWEHAAIGWLEMTFDPEAPWAYEEINSSTIQSTYRKAVLYIYTHTHTHIHTRLE